MAIILGIDIPDNKRSVIGFTSIYGIGRKTASTILNKTNIDPNKKIAELTKEEIARVLKLINEEYIVEGKLKEKIKLSIKRLMDIGCYVGRRHREGYPVRGQRTKNNCRSIKGSRKSMAKNKQKLNKKG